MAQALETRSIAGELLDARVDRLANEFMTEGAFDDNDFKVVQQASANMTVRVGSGTAGDRYVIPLGRERGTYLVRNPDAYVGSGNTDVAIANGGVQARIDKIVLKTYDDEFDSSGLTKTQVEVVQGTSAASPVAPATPTGAVALATVSVAAGLSSGITTAMITDVRLLTGGWTAHTPTFAGITLGNGTVQSRYKETPGEVTYKGRLRRGSTTTFGASNPLVVDLPVNARVLSTGVWSDQVARAMCWDISAGRGWLASGWIGVTNSMSFFCQSAGTLASGQVADDNPFTWATNDEFSWIVKYEPA